MTDQELKNLLASLTVDVKQLSETQKKTFESIKQRQDQTAANIDAFNKEVKQSIEVVNKEVNNKIDKLHATLSGVGQNNGDVAEEFFFNGLKEKMKIGKFKFSSIDKNVYRIKGKLQDEFDIVMTNTKSIVIFEVKYKYHPNDVEKVFKKIKNYKKLFPSNNHYGFYGGIAGLSMPKETAKKAKEYGFFVLTQSGSNLKLLHMG